MRAIDDKGAAEEQASMLDAWVVRLDERNDLVPRASGLKDQILVV